MLTFHSIANGNTTKFVRKINYKIKHLITIPHTSYLSFFLCLSIFYVSTNQFLEVETIKKKHYKIDK